jgi:hypothetical protein
VDERVEHADVGIELDRLLEVVGELVEFSDAPLGRLDALLRFGVDGDLVRLRLLDRDLPLAEALWLDAIVELVLGVELVLLDRRGVGQVGDAGADLVGLGAQ